MALNGRGVALDLYDSYEDILESHKTTHFLSGKRRGRILLQRVIFPQWSPSDLDHCDQRSVLSLPLSITGHYCLQMAGMVFGWHSLRMWCFDSVAPTSGIMMGTILTINFPRIYRTMATPPSGRHRLDQTNNATRKPKIIHLGPHLPPAPTIRIGSTFQATDTREVKRRRPSPPQKTQVNVIQFDQ